MPSAGNVVSPISNLFGNGSTKGASAAENNIANQQTNFYGDLQKDFGTAFAGQQNIIQGLAKAATNILQAGASQYGFSAAETGALNSMVINQNAKGAAQAMAEVGAEAAAAGGGANLPAGAVGSQMARVGENVAENTSQQLLGIQEAGYQAGRQNYQNAEQTLLGTAQLENPQGLAGQANEAGSQAFNSAYNIQKQNQAASPWAQVGGLVGSLAGTALNMVAPGAGTALGAISGLASAGNQQLAQNNPMGPSMNQAYGDNAYMIPQMPTQSLNLDQALYPTTYSPTSYGGGVAL